MTPSRPGLFSRFEALGDNCEFGLVQRQAGEEPLGLLRFAGFHIPIEMRLDRLLDALSREFAGLGDPESLQIMLDGRKGHEEYLVHDTTYDIRYHTFQSETDIDVDALRRQQSTHLRFLRRKLLDDLREPTKVLVWKTNLEQSIEDTMRLASALQAFGPNTLLWVVQGMSGYAPGACELLAPGVLRGHVDRFAPYDNAPDISFEPWREVCTNALALIAQDRPVAVHGFGNVDQPIFLDRRRLSDLLEQAGERLDADAIRLIDVVVPPGSYNRRAPVKTFAKDLLPREQIYHQYVSSLVQPFHALHHVALGAAIVTGQGAVISGGGTLIEDSCWESFVHGQVPFGLRLEQDGRLVRLAAPERHIRRPSLLVKRPWWRNFGHWLIDGAALLALLPRLRLPANCQIVTGAFEDARMRSVVADTLSVLCPGMDVVEQPDEAMWLFSELHYVTPVHQPPLFKSPEALRALRAAFLPEDRESKGGRRLFILRDPDTRRPLDNEADVAAVCRRLGFEFVRPETMRIADQARMFNAADFIVGAKGAALANIVFANPAASVIVLSPNDWADPFFWDIAGQLGIQYFEVFGPISSDAKGQAQNAFSIDLHELIDAIGFAHIATNPGVLNPPVTGGAPHVARQVFERQDHQLEGIEFIRPPHRGAFYQDVLSELHARLTPASYLEIGSLHGETLALAACPSLAVDPEFQLRGGVISAAIPRLHLFQMESDEFFRNHDPTVFLGRKVDLAFIDGLHLIENALRDFINVEAHCHPGSTIVVHDCIPLDRYMATRDRDDAATRERSAHAGWWTGDVWKLLPILAEYRLDLEVTAFDAPPTGLVVIRHLDPGSTMLARSRSEIEGRFAVSEGDAEAFARFFRDRQVSPTEDLPGLLRLPVPFEGGWPGSGRPVERDRDASQIRERPSA